MFADMNISCFNFYDENISSYQVIRKTETFHITKNTRDKRQKVNYLFTQYKRNVIFTKQM